MSLGTRREENLRRRYCLTTSTAQKEVSERLQAGLRDTHLLRSTIDMSIGSDTHKRCKVERLLLDSQFLDPHRAHDA